MEISEAAIASIEHRTRKQSQSQRWFLYRAGRITASTIKSVCTARIETPPISLVKKICYPSNKLNVAAVKYGKENEATALTHYKALSADVHTNARYSEIGLVISKEHPYFAATPDLIVECDCCGKGTVEVKCPYSVKDSSLHELPMQKRSRVTEESGSLVLKTSDTYYYQVQGQMFACNVSYCDFVLWKRGEINVERIVRDDAFLANALEKAKTFFTKLFSSSL